MSFDKLDIKNYNISKIKILNPIKRSNGYCSKILYNSKEFKIQTPLCTVREIDIKSEKPYIKISFKISKNFNHFQFFSNVHELCIENLITNTKNDEESVREKFIKNFEKENDSEIVMKLKLNKSTLFFDKNKTEISGLEIKKNDHIICSIKTNGILYDEKSSTQMWNCIQCLKFK